MSIAAGPPPIPGKVLDPPPKSTPDKVRELDAKSGAVGTGVGVGFRAYTRFLHAKASLLAAGTTYYLFLAMFSIVAFAYGLAAMLGSEQLADYVTEAVAEAFPGLLGEDGLSAAQMQATGQAASIIGLIGLVYAGGGGVNAAAQSLHLIYGAPKDPRNFVFVRVRALGWLALVGPLILLSFVASTFTSDVTNQVLDRLGVEWSGFGVMLRLVSAVLTLVANYAITYILLANLGGIRPAKRAVVIGSLVGAVVFELLKLLMATLITFTIDKPQYGAMTAPIGILFVLYLQSLTLYALASLTAGIADKDVPLDALAAAPEAPGPPETSGGDGTAAAAKA